MAYIFRWPTFRRRNRIFVHVRTPHPPNFGPVSKDLLSLLKEFQYPNQY